MTQTSAAQPRDAATVVIVRDGEQGLEVWMMRRVRAMAFAPSAWVFPGGAVELFDDVDASGWKTPSLDDVCDAMGAPGLRGRALLAAGVRETEEESGLQLKVERLVPWAHWLTPDWSPKRFDTWFFLTALPEGQAAANLGGEADAARWWSPGEALADPDVILMPPTLDSLERLSKYATVAEALADAPARLSELSG